MIASPSSCVALFAACRDLKVSFGLCSGTCSSIGTIVLLDIFNQLRAKESTMLIRTRTGITVGGFVATTDGLPVLLSMPDFHGRPSYGIQELIEDCDAAVMGRTTFLPALSAPSWPWPGLDVYVLTSTSLPPETPSDVKSRPKAARRSYWDKLRSRGSDRDVHLVGGPKTIRAFYELGALDRLEILVLPFLAGGGLPLSPQSSPPMRLRRLRSDRSYPDGTVEVVYTPE